MHNSDVKKFQEMILTLDFMYLCTLLLQFNDNIATMRASPGAAVKLCLGDLLVMGSNPETASLHMQG